MTKLKSGSIEKKSKSDTSIVYGFFEKISRILIFSQKIQFSEFKATFLICGGDAA
jgi:hypothetical protein